MSSAIQAARPGRGPGAPPARRHGRRAAPSSPGSRRSGSRGRGLAAALAVLLLSALVPVLLAQPVTTTEVKVAEVAAQVPSCPGAPLPEGYAMGDGYPYAAGSISGSAYNPQTITILARYELSGSPAPAAQRDCLARWTTGALLKGSREVAFTGPDGRETTALTFPYPFDFSANPALPPLRAGWLSGLAQGSALHLLALMFDRTGDPLYLQQAHETFNSFLLPASAGGFVTTVNGVTYLQEYPTSTPSYVLNGHNEATDVLVAWARRSGDPVAIDLARRSVAAVRTTSALEEVAYPTGVASSYDLLRGYPAAELRVLADGAMAVRTANLVDADGTVLSPLRLDVARPAPVQPDLLGNGSFARWSGSMPAGWRLGLRGVRTVRGARAGAGAAASARTTATARAMISAGRQPRTVRLAGTGRGTPVLYQDVPASVLVAGRWYTASWKAVVQHVPGSSTAPGRVWLSTVCGRQVTEIAVADVRSTAAVTETIEGQAQAGCGLRLSLSKADPVELPGAVEYSQVALRLAEPVGAATAPTYPVSVMAVPQVFASITYSGAGRLQGRFHGRWVDVATLPTGGSGPARVQIPAFLQGRNINLRYHNHHVGELDRLYRATGQDWLRDRALSWMDYAPATEEHRPSLTAAAAPPDELFR